MKVEKEINALQSDVRTSSPPPCNISEEEKPKKERKMVRIIVNREGLEYLRSNHGDEIVYHGVVAANPTPQTLQLLDAQGPSQSNERQTSTGIALVRTRPEGDEDLPSSQRIRVASPIQAPTESEIANLFGNGNQTSGFDNLFDGFETNERIEPQHNHSIPIIQPQQSHSIPVIQPTVPLVRGIQPQRTHSIPVIQPNVPLVRGFQAEANREMLRGSSLFEKMFLEETKKFKLDTKAWNNQLDVQNAFNALTVCLPLLVGSSAHSELSTLHERLKSLVDLSKSLESDNQKFRAKEDEVKEKTDQILRRVKKWYSDHVADA